MSDFLKRFLDGCRLVILALFNAIIAIPYFLLFLISQVKPGLNKPLRIALWVIVIILLLFLGRDWLPFETNTLLSIVISAFVLGVAIALGWLVVRWLKGIWRVLFIVIFLLILYVVSQFFILDLPGPIRQTLTPLPVSVAAIELQVEQAPPAEKKARREFLEKEWEQWHQQYYQTTQGNQIFPYDWFKALEQRSTFFALKNTTPYMSPENLTRYRVLTGSRGEWNPDGMPIGLPKDVDKFTSESWMGISCASCHTNPVSFKGKFYLIDGAPTLQDFSYTEGLIYALTNTLILPSKFDRFAKKVLGEGYGDAQKAELRGEVQNYLYNQLPSILGTYQAPPFQIPPVQSTYPTVEGFGRVDALGRGGNGQFLPWAKSNSKVANGPVSFPPLWYTHEFDWVQSVAAIQQPLGRNMTEAWGVNATIYTEPYRRFQTTLKPQNLFWIETYLSLTEPPDWPVSVFGKIDWEKVKRGKYLYEDKIWKEDLLAGADELPKAKLFEGDVPDPGFYKVIYPADKPRVQRGLCARCHEPQWAELTDWSIDKWGEQYLSPEKWNEYKKTPEGQKLLEKFKSKLFVKLRMYGLDVIGTDPNDAVNFNARQTSFYQIDAGPLADYFGKKQVGIAEALGKMTLEAKKTVYDQLDGLKKLPEDLPARAEWDGYRPNQFRAPLGYPARPMRGYWATAPYLHNGSVPNMYQLLSPVAERDKVFYVGAIDYDPEHMGYSTGRRWGVFDWFFNRGLFKFDTRISGNLNGGHEFRDVKPGESSFGVVGPYLPPEDRLAIIEYLKVLKDISYAPEQPLSPNRGQYGDDEQYAAAKAKYDFEQRYYDYCKEENYRRWRILESMTFNPGSTLFELKQPYSK